VQNHWQLITGKTNTHVFVSRLTTLFVPFI